MSERTLRGPGDPIVASDGLYTVANGKHSVAAWKSFLSSADAHQLEGEQNLVHLEGLQVNLVYFENLGGQEELRVHMGIMHDQESSSNRYKQTSFESKYEIIQAARAKVAGRPLQSLHLFWKWFVVSAFGVFI